MRGKHRKVVWSGFLLTGFVIVTSPYLLTLVSSFLVIQDPLEEAVAIVALGGHPPIRALAAAELFHEGWAPKVILTKELRREAFYYLAELGIRYMESHEYNRQALLRKGVPEGAIQILEPEADNTRDELNIVLRNLELKKGEKLILVTSKAHTRRVKLIWKHVNNGSHEAIVRWTRLDPFDPDCWWQQRQSILAVVREYLGVGSYLLGFPLG